MSAVCGVDPGTQGGLAVLHATGNVLYLRAFQPSMTRSEFAEILRTAAGLLRAYESRDVFLEKVNSRPGEGHQGAFTFGRVYGWPEMGCAALGLTVHDVYPMMWQARLECPTGGDKNVSKRRAIELFPREQITHAVADALLIAEYGRRFLALK